MDSQGVPVRQNDGQIRFGKEFAESTFRKVYHALQTLHIHFQQENEYKVIQVAIIFSDYHVIDIIIDWFCLRKAHGELM